MQEAHPKGQAWLYVLDCGGGSSHFRNLTTRTEQTAPPPPPQHRSLTFEGPALQKLLASVLGT